jgi:hypothetical protein
MAASNISGIMRPRSLRVTPHARLERARTAGSATGWYIVRVGGQRAHVAASPARCSARGGGSPRRRRAPRLPVIVARFASARTPATPCRLLGHAEPVEDARGARRWRRGARRARGQVGGHARDRLDALRGARCARRETAGTCRRRSTRAARKSLSKRPSRMTTWARPLKHRDVRARAELQKHVGVARELHAPRIDHDELRAARARASLSRAPTHGVALGGVRPGDEQRAGALDVLVRVRAADCARGSG